MKLYLSIFLLISKKKIISLIVISFLLFITIILELLSIGSMIALVNSVSSKNVIGNFDYINKVFEFFGLSNFNGKNFIFIFVILIFIYILLIISKILLNLSNGYLSFSLGHYFNKLVYSNILEKDYFYYMNNNSSRFLGAIAKSEQMRAAIFYTISFFTSVTLAFFIITNLFFLDRKLTLYSFFFITLFYYFFFRILKNIIVKIGFYESEFIDKRYKIITESFSNFKEIIILNIKNYFFYNFIDVDKKLTKNNIIKNAIATVPGQVVLIFGLATILIIISIFQDNSGELTISLPTLLAFIFSLQKLLPYFNAAYDSLIKLKASKKSIKDVFAIIKNSNNYQKSLIGKKKRLNFKNKIEIRDGFFQYSINKKYILNSLNLKIYKNTINGIYGKTGCGKSTFLNILAGLLFFNKGKFLVDNVEICKQNSNNWQRNIFYISQENFFLDGSILENITFKKNYLKNDVNKVNKCLKIAELYNDIDNLENKIYTKIGERGINLSGGQKQRLAIARALYFDRQILILDEATNALDEKTENKIYNNIKTNLRNKTVIIISHRKSIYRFCDKIFKLTKRKIYCINYNQL